MIKLKVLKSNNPDYLGSYVFYKNLVYVGSNFESDLYFPESNLRFNHIFIEIVEDKLITHIHQEVDYITVNGKRTTKFKLLQKNDVIEIEDIKIKIEEFSTTQYKTRKEALNEAARKVPETKPELIPLISELNQS